MTMLKFRQALTVGAMRGTAETAGISVMSSGTSVISVAAAQAQSGAIIQASPSNYGSVVASQEFKGVAVDNVAAGTFEIRAIGSMCPVEDLPVAWNIIK